MRVEKRQAMMKQTGSIKEKKKYEAKKSKRHWKNVLRV
jgi:hypothetical protein